MKAIITKKLPATDRLGARVKASASGVQSLVISYWSDDDAHAAAALALARREGWKGELARGGLPDESGEAFVFIDNRYPIEV
jgi:hypothetical protein